MATKIWTEYFDTWADANQAARTAKDRGQRGYSEVYSISGPTEIELIDGSLKWEVKFKSYYG